MRISLEKGFVWKNDFLAKDYIKENNIRKKSFYY